MDLNARFYKKLFKFKRPIGTSRGILTEKYSWYIELWNPKDPDIVGIGECSIIPGLSPDFVDIASYETKIESVCRNLKQDINDWPSIKFGVETALLDMKNGGKRIIYDNDFSRSKKGIPINGLIWMGDEGFMKAQIQEKIELGFTTIKMKIGALDFDKEYRILNSIKENYSSNEITLRVDANGAFSTNDALKKLTLLAELGIHSIEQPIKAGQWTNMKELCQQTPLPIALDEELIGINSVKEKMDVLETIKPQFIVIKPSLHGGISGSREWIEIAESKNIKWWMTSALESNIGLNAICQFTAEFDNELPQGLGTGSLYTENISSNLVVQNGSIYYR
jgi:o-succinylbenzoate synthase